MIGSIVVIVVLDDPFLLFFESVYYCCFLICLSSLLGSCKGCHYWGWFIRLSLVFVSSSRFVPFLSLFVLLIRSVNVEFFVLELLSVSAIHDDIVSAIVFNGLYFFEYHLLNVLFVFLG